MLIYLPLINWSLCSFAVIATPPETCLPPSSPTVESSIAPELPVSTSSSSTSQAEVHCSSDCCRDLTKSHQPRDPAILSGTRRVQGVTQKSRSVQPQWFQDFKRLTLSNAGKNILHSVSPLDH
ncbi:hypothetical protein ILYODFUR_038944 [Ilyodon furcidens]|uniref:Secreted protein n=1 Tax=Ilyodon furcidens TaxID=33524 RepID=A0ABV0UEQ9_9TELE